jgi:hypothetical protein
MMQMWETTYIHQHKITISLLSIESPTISMLNIQSLLFLQMDAQEDCSSEQDSGNKQHKVVHWSM